MVSFLSLKAFKQRMNWYVSDIMDAIPILNEKLD